MKLIGFVVWILFLIFELFVLFVVAQDYGNDLGTMIVPIAILIVTLVVGAIGMLLLKNKR